MTFPTFADLVEIARPITQDHLDALCRKAETGEQWAEICRLEAIKAADEKRDPREPDHSREGIFAYHNCWKCNDGERACAEGYPYRCGYPRARND